MFIHVSFKLLLKHHQHQNSGSLFRLLQLGRGLRPKIDLCPYEHVKTTCSSTREKERLANSLSVTLQFSVTTIIDFRTLLLIHVCCLIKASKIQICLRAAACHFFFYSVMKPVVMINDATPSAAADETSG